MKKLPLTALEMLVHPKVEIGRNSLRLIGDVTDEEMLEVLGVLRRIEGTLAWMVGDFLSEVGRLRGSERAGALLEYFGVSDRWAWRCWRTCRLWPIDERVTGVSFTHHEEALSEVGSKAAAKPWVEKAQANGWSVAEMRRQMRGRRLQGGTKAKQLSFADIYGAVAWARRVSPGALTAADRATLKQDLKPVVDFYGKL